MWSTTSNLPSDSAKRISPKDLPIKPKRCPGVHLPRVNQLIGAPGQEIPILSSHMTIRSRATAPYTPNMPQTYVYISYMYTYYKHIFVYVYIYIHICVYVA